MRGYLDLSWTVKPKLCGHQPPSTGPSTLLCSPSIFPSPISLKGQSTLSQSEISYPISLGMLSNTWFIKKIFNTQWECLQLLLFPPTNVAACEPLLFSSPSARGILLLSKTDSPENILIMEDLSRKLVLTWKDDLMEEIWVIFCVYQVSGGRINLELLPNKISAGYLKKERWKNIT